MAAAHLTHVHSHVRSCHFISIVSSSSIFSPLALPPRQIRLSSKAYTPDAAAVVAKAIGNARATLTHLDLSDTIASLPVREAGVLPQDRSPPVQCALEEGQDLAQGAAV